MEKRVPYLSKRRANGLAAILLVIGGLLIAFTKTVLPAVIGTALAVIAGGLLLAGRRLPDTGNRPR